MTVLVILGRVCFNAGASWRLLCRDEVGDGVRRDVGAREFAGLDVSCVSALGPESFGRRSLGFPVLVVVVVFVLAEEGGLRGPVEGAAGP